MSPRLRVAVVVVLAGLLRLVRLGAIPAGMTADEALNGYTALSLGTTLRDAWGHLLPLFPSHYGVNIVEPLYIYVLVPIVRLAGLAPWTVRLEAALVGTATVLLTYVLVADIADRRTALWAALLLALSPWHVTFSRIGFRGIWAPLATVVVLLCWYRIRRDERYVVAFAAAVGCGLYTYTPMWVFLPLVLLVLAATSPDVLRLVLASRYRWRAAAVLLVLALPVAFAALDPAFTVRARYLLEQEGPRTVGAVLASFASHLSPRFLLTRGDGIARHGVFGYGVLSPVTAALMVVFLFTARRRRGLWAFPALFLCAMVPSALTAPGAHALRSLPALPFPQVMAAFAVEEIARRFRGRLVRAVVAAAVLVYAGVVFADYFANQPLHHSGRDADGRFYANWWNDGLGEAIAWAQEHRDSWDGVALSSSINGAYVYPAFWVPIPPAQFQHGEDISPYHVVEWQRLHEAWETIPGALFIVQPWELPDEPAVAVIRFADGLPAFRLVESRLAPPRRSGG